MFSSLTSPQLVIANLIATLLLAVMFYLHHPRKYDTMLIFIVGNMIGLIVRFFVDLEIGVGTGFGLFAIFSLMHFRESYHTYTMVYIFIGLSFGILSSLMTTADLNFFIILIITILVIVLIFERLLRSVKKVAYTVSIEELRAGIRDRIVADLGDVKILDI